ISPDRWDGGLATGARSMGALATSLVGDGFQRDGLSGSVGGMAAINTSEPSAPKDRTRCRNAGERRHSARRAIQVRANSTILATAVRNRKGATLSTHSIMIVSPVAAVAVGPRRVV